VGLSRRMFFSGAGGASVALVGAGGIFSVTRTPHAALQPWTDIETTPSMDVRLDAFRHGILAPNPHNRQPWLIRLVGTDQAVITCDLEKRLPETDPNDRQTLIGFGCFLELARMAAAERGVRMAIQAFPEGVPGERLDKRPVAHLRFVADGTAQKDPLFSFVPVRRTNKQPFDLGRAVPGGVMNALAAQRVPGISIGASTDAARVGKLRALTWDAWVIELQTQRTWMETVNLMRIGKSEIEANPDGVSVGGVMLEALAMAGQISRREIGRPGSVAFQASMDRYRPILASAMAYVWIVTEGNLRIDQLAAGMSYVRMNLHATMEGLGFHPASQALQEFPEMARPFSDVHAVLGVQRGQRVQMLVRLGYGAAVARTPRWPMERHLVDA
jgi:Nitroreductase family